MIHVADLKTFEARARSQDYSRASSISKNYTGTDVTIFLGVATLLLLLVVAVWLILSARDLESRISTLLRDQVDRIHDAEESLERLRLQSNRTQ